MNDSAHRLEKLPRLSLVSQPTPMHAAPRLSASVGGPGLWFKRDDLIASGFGGNKVRALDVIVADAITRGADSLVTGAGSLSNHVRAAAAIASLKGLAFAGVYWGPPPACAEGNHRLAIMLGADIRFTGDPDRTSVDAAIEETAREFLAKGRHPYRIPRGGACPLGALAHALAVRETLTQCAALGVAPRCVVMAVGGGATLAGWLLGSALFNAPWRIDAFTVSRPAREAAAQAEALAVAGAELIGYRIELDRAAFRMNEAYIGAGYGVASPEGRRAIEATARAEAIFLDPVYTGKAMAGYMAQCARGDYAGIEDVLFLHTGGAPALFTSAAEAS